LIVTECGPVTLEGSPTSTVPLVIVDAADRPDLLDLGRVFVQDQPGGGEVHTSWDLLVYGIDEDAGPDTSGDRPRGYVSLIITMSRPVTGSLKILFALPEWIDALEQIELAPKLAIALGPPNEDGTWDPLKVMTLGSPGSHAHNVIRDAVDLVERWGEVDGDSA
jgi:hypothetical protein